MYTRPFGRCLLAGVLIWAAALCCLALPATGEAAPLLQEGKKSLYQRVISHPGAVLRQSADAASAVVQDKVVPFTVFYVYERAGGWLRVGTGLNEPQGWLEEGKTTAWNQSLTLLFAPRAGRDPVLFFKAENDLKTLCSASDMEKAARYPADAGRCRQDGRGRSRAGQRARRSPGRGGREALLPHAHPRHERTLRRREVPQRGVHRPRHRHGAGPRRPAQDRHRPGDGHFRLHEALHRPEPRRGAPHLRSARKGKDDR